MLDLQQLIRRRGVRIAAWSLCGLLVVVVLMVAALRPTGGADETRTVGGRSAPAADEAGDPSATPGVDDPSDATATPGAPSAGGTGGGQPAGSGSSGASPGRAGTASGATNPSVGGPAGGGQPSPTTQPCGTGTIDVTVRAVPAAQNRWRLVAEARSKVTTTATFTDVAWQVDYRNGDFAPVSFLVRGRTIEPGQRLTFTSPSIEGGEIQRLQRLVVAWYSSGRKECRGQELG